jgi:hypothetical protein
MAHGTDQSVFWLNMASVIAGHSLSLKALRLTFSAKAPGQLKNFARFCVDCRFRRQHT